MCKKAICCHNCPDKSVWKKVLVWKKVTLVEKGHLGSISRPRPQKTLPWCPFSTSVTFFFTLGQFFLTICPDNYDNKILLPTHFCYQSKCVLFSFAHPLWCSFLHPWYQIFMLAGKKEGSILLWEINFNCNFLWTCLLVVVLNYDHLWSINLELKFLMF